jgi:hypothetical protein
MKIFPRIVRSALLVTTPTVIAYPTNKIPRFVVQQVNHQTIQIPDLRTLSYDEVVDLLSKIESDYFDEKYSEDELDQINQFVSLLAMEGATDGEKLEVEYAVTSLFRKNDIQYALFNPSVGYTIQPVSISKALKIWSYVRAGSRSSGIKQDLLLRNTKKPSLLVQLLW